MTPNARAPYNFRMTVLTAFLLALAMGWNAAVSAQRPPENRIPKTEPPEATAAEPPREGEGIDSTGPADGSEKPAVDTPPKPEPTTLFGDTKRFNRYGGWGGIGGSMGQWGFARSMLVMMPPVQQEIELTEEQKKKLREWSETMSRRGREMGEQMRRQGEQSFRLGDVTTIMRMMNLMSGLLKENENGVARILDAKQRKRLDEIALQMEGVTALARPEVGRKVSLTPQQAQRIQELLSQSQMRQMGFFMQRAMAMREAARNGARPDLGPQGPAPRNAQARNRDQPRTGVEPPAGAESDRSGQPDPTARQQQAEQFRQQFEDMRSGSDRIQDETVQAILKVLAPKQRRTFDKLLGEPFEPEKLNQMFSGSQGRGPGDRGGRPPVDDD